MKLTTLSILLPSLVQGLVVNRDHHIASRQDKQTETSTELATNNGGIPLRKAAKITEIKSLSGVPGAKRLKVVYGPFKIKGPGDTQKLPGTFPSMDPTGTSYNFRLDSDFPRDITVLLATSGILTADMKPATLDDKIYNHHNAFMEAVTSQEPMWTCENGSPAKEPPPINLFAGTSTEKISFNFTSDSTSLKTGFYIGKDALLQNMLDLVNSGPTADFYSDNEIEFVPGQPAGFLNSKQTIVNPDICGGADGYKLAPPKGQRKFSIASNGVVVNQSGYITRARGHLHDGGTDITMEVNGKVVCKSDALYGGPGFSFKAGDGKTYDTINQSTECTNPIKLSKGDKLKISANFDLNIHPSRPMGAGAAEAGAASKGGHGGHKKRNMMDGDGEAEQMGLMFINWAPMSM